MEISYRHLKIIRNSLYIAESVLRAGATPVTDTPEATALSGQMDELRRLRQEVEARMTYIKESLDL